MTFAGSYCVPERVHVGAVLGVCGLDDGGAADVVDDGVAVWTDGDGDGCANAGVGEGMVVATGGPVGGEVGECDA